MCRLIESIKILNGQIQNIEYHNRRFNQSRNDIFGIKDMIDLESTIKIPETCLNGIYKCRIIYGEKTNSIEFIEYVPKKISTIKIVKADSLEYEYKYEDREDLNNLLSTANTDEIIIIKNGYVTDTSYSNIVFENGNKYLTPAKPLLKGTMREKLLLEGIIIEDEIKLLDIKKFEKFYFINAMLELEKEKGISISRLLI